jgi:dihydropteroate synthase
MSHAATQSPGISRGFADSGALYIRPLVIIGEAATAARIAAGHALPLAGGPLAFESVEVAVWARGSERKNVTAPVTALRAWAVSQPEVVRARVGTILERLTKARPDIAGLTLGRPRVMGILNVTPDSFYDGGRYNSHADATARGAQLLADGADILDVGGESTRPGATPVDQNEELARVMPVVEAMARDGARVSVDTRQERVMRAAAAAGAALINDVAALSLPGSLKAAAETGLPVVLMHSNADPRTMQDDPRYGDVALEVYDYLEGRIAAAEEAGIPRARIVVDPGIGFAKTAVHNAALLESLALFHGLGCPVMLGASRKSFIGKFHRGVAADDRLAGSVAAALWAAAQGVQFLRVHDVAETVQAMAVWRIAGNHKLLPDSASAN